MYIIYGIPNLVISDSGPGTAQELHTSFCLQSGNGLPLHKDDTGTEDLMNLTIVTGI